MCTCHISVKHVHPSNFNYYIHFEINGGPCNLIGSIYSRIAAFFALNRIFCPANDKVTLKTKQPIRFQGLFKSNQ